MMPIVTVWPMPSGLPTASATSPTRTLSESASGSVCRLVPSILSTARSLGASVPTTLASNVRPSRHLDLDLIGAVDDVVVGEDVAVRRGRSRPSRGRLHGAPRGACRPRNWSPKNCRSSGSSGSCELVSRTRRSDVTVTTAGAICSTSGAYESAEAPIVRLARPPARQSRRWAPGRRRRRAGADRRGAPADQRTGQEQRSRRQPRLEAERPALGAGGSCW